MKKKDLIYEIAVRTKTTRKLSEEVLNTALDLITEKLQEGEKVQLSGFGTFEVRSRAPRLGRNMHTGEFIAIEAGKVPAFRPGNSLKAAITGEEPAKKEN